MFYPRYVHYHMTFLPTSAPSFIKESIFPSENSVFFPVTNRFAKDKKSVGHAHAI